MSRATAPAPHAAASGRGVSSATRTAVRIALAAFLIFAATGGGRIVGSDEVTMFELSRAVLAGHIDVPEGATLQGPDGRFYSKNAATEAIVALPLVALGGVAANAAHLPEPRRTLAVRFVASFLNAVVTALLLGVCYAAARGFGVRPGAALGATALLGFTTPVWVYSKSFMAEPLQALGLLLTLVGCAHAASGQRRAGWVAGLGACLAVSAKLSMLPLALACALPLLPPLGTRRAAWLPVAAGFVVALAAHAGYDAARFGTPFETGYGAQASAAAYTTPFLVGLYGLVLSSGKGVLWFAPALWLAFAGWNAMRHARGVAVGPREPASHFGPPARAAWGALAAWCVALLLYARFQHWAGDGSFGPRYLVPLLPLAFLAVAFALDRASRARRRIAWALGVLGLVVQIGGVAIYFGAEMREVGDYPYTLPLDHPRFMSDSHFNPRFSPIGAHWRMLIRNAGEHLRGEAPKLTGGGESDARVGVGTADQARLLHALDFWWLYLGYAGFPSAPVLAALLVLVALGASTAVGATRAALAEGRAP